MEYVLTTFDHQSGELKSFFYLILLVRQTTGLEVKYLGN